MTQKTLYLCRGLPGSGKTTLAKLIAPDYHYASDDYWDETGIAFNTGQLPDAHQQCIDRVNSAMELGANPIAVHNTLSESWEATRYFLVAEKHGYSVFVIECQNDFGSVHASFGYLS